MNALHNAFEREFAHKRLIHKRQRPGQGNDDEDNGNGNLGLPDLTTKSTAEPGEYLLCFHFITGAKCRQYLWILWTQCSRRTFKLASA
jgi:hypothetical protein